MPSTLADQPVINMGQFGKGKRPSSEIEGGAESI